MDLETLTLRDLRRFACRNGAQRFWSFYKNSIYVRKADLISLLSTFHYLTKRVTPIVWFYRRIYRKRLAYKVRMAIRIQSKWRQYLCVCGLAEWHGPAWNCRHLCVNDTDFLSLEPLANIPFDCFVSLKDNGVLFGFSLYSIAQWIQKAKTHDIIRNPYNRNPLPNNFLIRVDRMHSYLTFKESLARQQQEQQHLLHSSIYLLFQTLSEYGPMVASPEWLLQMKHFTMTRLILKLYTLWMDVVPVDEHKRLYPPHGLWYQDITALQTQNEYEFRESLARFLLHFILQCHDDLSRALLCKLVLASFVQVVPDASAALPWLLHYF